MTEAPVAPDPSVGGIELPARPPWVRIDLTAETAPHQADAVVEYVLSTTPALRPWREGIRHTVLGAVESAASSQCQLVLVRPAGDDGYAVTGLVRLTGPLELPVEELYTELEDAGLPVALGALDGVPVLSMVEMPHDDGPPVLGVSYLLVAATGTAVLQFSATWTEATDVIIAEIARFMNGVRLIRDKCSHSDVVILGGVPGSGTGGELSLLPGR